MTPSYRTFLALRWSLLRCAVLLLAAAGAALGARQMTAQAASAERQQIARHDELYLRLANAADATDAPRWKARYEEMLAHGVIGPERRLDWVERIAQIKEARQLIDVQYELAPQTAATAEAVPAPASAGGYEFMASAMKLQMALLHEEDLLGFLDDLAVSVPAFLHVRNCNVERVAADAEAAGVARLKADCSLDWITLREQP
jgi:hypothetical protein